MSREMNREMNREMSREMNREMKADLGRPELGWLEDPEIFRVGRLDAHSDHRYYDSEEDCGNGRQSLIQSLNGTWQFEFFENAAAAAEATGMWADGAQPEGTAPYVPAGSIQVPGHMELAGFGQVQYTNTAYPWDGHCFLRPPRIDWEHNYAGYYVREFDLEPALAGKRICLSLQGAERAVYVWLNGTFIGYGEDSFTPTEFDVTGIVRERGNRLCIAVFRYSSASWVEDQDFFRFTGLFRDVLLRAKPESHIEDISVTADWRPESGEGELSFRVRMSGQSWRQLDWELRDGEGRRAACGQVNRGAAPGGEERDSGTVRIPGIRPWRPGAPVLYDLTVRVRSADGGVLEIVPVRVGFRHFEIRDRVMTLNGERLLINGVNRHEWSPRRGRAITEEEMREDIRILRRNHINAVRTSHYPNQSLWYRLCDEAGICVMDETNMESHGTCMKMGITETSWNIPGSDPAWLACCLDRAASMYERDKNHPCILWWSAGNESHAGTVIEAMCDYFHEKDRTRLVHYEGVFYDRTFDSITDVESRMYPAPEAVREYLEKDGAKPMLLCEYMHDMGNSLGGFESYMKLRDEFPSFQGGFIWDYIDQALYRKGADGEACLGYGGDFLDRPTDYAFSANGIVAADRGEKPAMQEVRYWYMTAEERGAFDRESDRTGEELRARAAAEADAYSLPVSEPPSCTVPRGPVGSSGLRYAGGAAEGAGGRGDSGSGHEYLRAVHTDFNLGLYGDGFHYVFSFGEGGPVSLVMNGREQLFRAPRPTFWRAPTENDRGCGFPAAAAAWLGADSFTAVSECAVEERGEDFAETLIPNRFAERKPARDNIRETELRYTFRTATAPQTTVTVSYLVNARGRIQVTLRYSGNPGLPELPAFGLQFLTPKPLPDFRWDGRSGETYPDRFRGGRFGTHRGRPEIPNYLVPQECANHMDTFRLAAGDMVFLAGDRPFSCSVLPWTPRELGEALHREELPRPSRSVIRILGAIRGVGGIDSWGSDVESPWHIDAGEDMEFSFCIVPGRRPA